MEDRTAVVDTSQVTLDWCDECAAVVRSDDPCGHENLEWMRLVEW